MIVATLSVKTLLPEPSPPAAGGASFLTVLIVLNLVLLLLNLHDRFAIRRLCRQADALRDQAENLRDQAMHFFRQTVQLYERTKHEADAKTSAGD